MDIKNNMSQIVFLYLFPTILIWYSCSNENSVLKQANDNIRVENDSTSFNQDSLFISKVEVLNFQKKEDINSNFYDRYKEECDQWNLSKDKIVEILLNSRQMDGSEFHDFFDVLPCYYEGSIKINNEINGSFKVNAGSFAVVFVRDTSFYLGYYGKNNYFIVKPDTQE